MTATTEHGRGIDALLPAPRHLVVRGPGTAVCERRGVWAADARARELFDTLIGGMPPAADRDAALVRLEQGGEGPAGSFAIEADGGVTVSAASWEGLVWGVQTLRQLLADPAGERTTVTDGIRGLPVFSLRDEPRFAWRGAHLDVARWHRPVADVERYIDWASMHRLNVVHLHLTDDQGWRFEVKRYPRLTGIGARRAQSRRGLGPDAVLDGTPHGGFHTQAELRGLVAYAALRGVTLVPEIDAPGHMQAAVAAYPRLGNDPRATVPVSTQWGVMEHVLNAEEDTVRFVCDVLDELVDVFPSRYVHIGGDECPKTEWRASPRAQQLMAERGLADEDQLQSWFVRRLAAHLASRGRTAIGWDEILEGGAPPGAVVMSWRGEAGGIEAARHGHDVIMAPNTHVYFDHEQVHDVAGEPVAAPGTITWQDVYGWSPVPDALAADPRLAARVLGVQCALWGEHLPDLAALTYQAFPRLAVFAEVAWGTAGELDAFRPRLAAHLARLRAAGIEGRPLER